MGDDPLSWLIPAGAFGAVILFFVVNSRGQQKRKERFHALAARRGVIVETISEHSPRFTVAVHDRAIEVRDEYRGGGVGSSGSGNSYFTTATPLRGRAWDLHSVKIGKRFWSKPEQAFERRFNVEEFGLPLPADWLTEDVRAAVEAMFALDIRGSVIELDAGELLHRSLVSPTELTPETFDALLERQVVLARSIERARPR